MTQPAFTAHSQPTLAATSSSSKPTITETKQPPAKAGGINFMMNNKYSHRKQRGIDINLPYPHRFAFVYAVQETRNITLRD